MKTYKVNFAFMVAVFVSFLGEANVGHAKDCITSVDETVLFSSGEISHVGERVVDFIAVIGPHDLTNSKGKRLSNFSTIIQQDRANYHKFNRIDAFEEIKDGAEDYFITFDRRQILSKAPYYYDCFMNNQDIVALHNDVLSGKLVTIWIVLFRQPNGSLAVYSTPVG
jgi:hypothetical protein